MIKGGAMTEMTVLRVMMTMKHLWMEMKTSFCFVSIIPAADGAIRLW
jgi:hypothetical protein